MSKKKRLPKWLRVMIFCFTSGLVAGVIYFWLTYDYYQTKPAPFVDAYAELNARNDGYTEDEKAWLVYFDADYNHWREASQNIEIAKSALLSAEEEKTYSDPLYEPADPFSSTHNQFGIPPEHMLYEEVLETIEQLQPQIQAIREAAERPVFGTPIVDVPNDDGVLEFVPEWYPNPPSVDPLDSLPLLDAIFLQLGTSRALTRLLELDAQIALDERDMQRVVSDLQAMLGLARQTAGEPGILSVLVGIAAQHEVCEIVHKAIADGPSQAETRALLRLRPLLDRQRADPIRLRIEDERLTQLDLVGRIYSDDGRGDGFVTVQGLRLMEMLGSAEPTPPIVFALAWPLKDRFASKVEILDHIKITVNAFEQLQATGVSGIAEYNTKLRDIARFEQSPKRVLLKTSFLGSSWKRAFYTETQAKTYLHATRTLLALEHHRLEAGTYPNSLTDLIPDYLDTIPEDPFDPGNPLKYRLIDNIPHLYSVGSDGDDDLARRPNSPNPSTARDFELRFADPAGPSPTAPDADWVIFPPSP